MSFVPFTSGGEDTNFYAAGGYALPSMTTDFANLAAGIAGVGEAMKGIKRARTSTVTQTEDATAGGGPVGQFVRASGTFGKPKTFAQLARKLQKLDRIYYEQIWQRITRWTKNYTTGAGAVIGPEPTRSLPIAYSSNWSGNPNLKAMPLYIWDLTSRAPMAGSASQNVCHRLLSDNATNRISWQAVGSTYKDGVTNTNPNWSGYRTTGTNEDMIAQYDKTILKDVKCQFMLTGNATAITRWYIDMVQIHEDEYLPTILAPSVGATAFWRRFMRQNISHPMTGQPGEFSETGRMNLLRRWEYKINPDSTTNSDASPPSLMVELDINLNRLMRWDYDPTILVPAATEALYENPAKFDVQVNSLNDHTQTYLHDPMARIYLVLRCHNGTEYTEEETAGNIATGMFPTFDARLRAMHLLSYSFQ